MKADLNSRATGKEPGLKAGLGQLEMGFGQLIGQRDVLAFDGGVDLAMLGHCFAQMRVQIGFFLLGVGFCKTGAGETDTGVQGFLVEGGKIGILRNFGFNQEINLLILNIYLAVFYSKCLFFDP